MLLLIPVGTVATGGSLHAQTAPAQTAAAPNAPAPTGKTIAIRMLDSKTGHLIATSEYLVQINHQETIHANWVREVETGAGEMTVPPDATVVNIHAKYDDSMSARLSLNSAAVPENPILPRDMT